MELRAKLRERAVHITKAADSILELPVRTRPETLKVQRPSRVQYLSILVYRAAWGIGVTTAVMDPSADAVSMRWKLTFLITWPRTTSLSMN